MKPSRGDIKAIASTFNSSEANGDIIALTTVCVLFDG